MKFSFFLAFFFLMLSFEATAQINQTKELLKPGDTVILRIKDAADAEPINTAFRVSDKGMMKLPLLENEIEAAGITVIAVVGRINDSCRAAGITAVAELPKWEPYVNSGTITISGAVPKPGKYPLRQGFTVYQAINRAGGFADENRMVKIQRNNKETIYDLSKIKPDGSNNPALTNGDRIVVPAFPATPALPGLLEPGDSVIIILRKPEEESHKITTTYTISAQGAIKLPLLKQEIPAAGISAATLARRIEAFYISAKIYAAPIFNVVLEPRVKMNENAIVVAGEVQKSGEYPWGKEMTLMGAIEQAGGFTEFAGISRVRLIRGSKELSYDLREIKPEGSNNPTLLDQDQIIVPMD